MQFGIGVALGEPGRKCLALDMVYENWKGAEFDDEYDPHYFRDKYRSTVNWRLGIEHPLPFFNTVGRIGYLRQPSPFKGPRSDDIWASDIIVKNDRDFVTCGFSTHFDESLTMDVGYAHGFWSEKEGDRLDKDTHDRVYVSLIYRLPLQYK